MKKFVVLAFVAGFVSMNTARAESAYRCAEEVEAWCSWPGSPITNPSGFKSAMERKSDFCAAYDYAGSGGEGGFSTKIRTFKMKNGDLTTVLIHTNNGANDKCLPKILDLKTIYGQDVRVKYILSSRSRLWATTENGNLLVMGLGTRETGSEGRPLWFAVTTADGREVLNRVERIYPNGRDNGIVVKYKSGSVEEFLSTYRAFNTLVNGAPGVPSRAKPITVQNWYGYNY